MSNQFKYSVVIPTLNSAEFIEETVSRISASLQKLGLDYELIIIDDFSTDNTWEIIKSINSQSQIVVKGIRLSKNFGQHKATMCGFNKAEGDFVITMDDDLESDPESIPLLIEEQEKSNADLVYAHYTNLKRGPVRLILFSVFRFFAKLIEGKKRVHGSSFRLLKTTLAKKVIKNANSFSFIDELFLWNTERVEFVNIKHRAGLRGKSNYTIRGLVNTSTELVLFSSDFPLRFIKYLGMTFAVVNFLIGSFYIVRKLIGKVDEPGFAALIVSILFSTGIILLAIGVIGEYLNKVFKSVQNMPLYSIGDEV
ncbi:MAG: glycosyltransferase family 2 protein [Crocinitomicaceae bacterium]|nr:glycosyltransferase family 2 protein [Crocinitomicaceae bacterium]MBT5404070.1 glycosyltransferase family 2 protein [Crocinitomicaceae bacterium]